MMSTATRVCPAHNRAVGIWTGGGVGVVWCCVVLCGVVLNLAADYNVVTRYRLSLFRPAMLSFSHTKDIFHLNTVGASFWTLAMIAVSMISLR